jgi:hypothetical protein
VVDAEVPEREVGLPGRHVVVRVVRGRGGEVRRADGLAQEADADPGRWVEQRAHGLVACHRREPVEHARGGIGDRRAEAVDPLVTGARVDHDGGIVAGARAERDPYALVQQFGPVGRGDPDAYRHRWAGVPGRRDGAAAQKQDSGGDRRADRPSYHRALLRRERVTPWNTACRTIDRKQF